LKMCLLVWGVKFLATCAQDTSHILAFALAPP
jgi:hypothetical protein